MEHRDLMHFLETNLTRQLQWIGAADSKVTFGFTLSTAMLGLLAAVSPKSAACWTVAPAIFASFAAALGLSSLLFLSFASFPRTHGPKSSLIYFEGIVQRDHDQFKDAIKSLTQEAYVDDLASQCHRNAEIAARKFLWVQCALVCLYVSVPPWAVAIYLLYSI